MITETCRKESVLPPTIIMKEIAPADGFSILTNKKGAALCGPVKLLRLRLDYFPVPDRLEVCGLPATLSLTCNVPVSVPVCVGWKTTLIVQLAFAARLEEQVVDETLNSPVVEIEIPVSSTVCLFDSLNAFAALVVPTAVFGNFALAGVNVTATSPVPVSGTCCGLLPALSVMVMSPVRAPTWVGVNVTWIKQLAPWARVLPQVVELMAKSPLGVMLPMFSVAEPLFLMVTVFAADVSPTISFPNAKDAGVRVTTGAVPAVTVRLTVVVFVKVPDVPETVIP